MTRLSSQSIARAAVLATLCCAELLPARASTPGLAVDPPRLLHAHVLTNQMGQAATFPAHDGRWQLAFFGYTHCADVCPMTLHKIGLLLSRLGKAADRINVMFVSLDSERDGPARLKEFLAPFDGRIEGLTGDPDALAAVAGELGVLVRRYQGKTALAYTLQHSSFVYLLDPQGAVHRIYPAAVDVDTMAADLAALIPP